MSTFAAYALAATLCLSLVHPRPVKSQEIDGAHDADTGTEDAPSWPEKPVPPELVPLLQGYREIKRPTEKEEQLCSIVQETVSLVDKLQAYLDSEDHVHPCPPLAKLLEGTEIEIDCPDEGSGVLAGYSAHVMYNKLALLAPKQSKSPALLHAVEKLIDWPRFGSAGREAIGVAVWLHSECDGDGGCTSLKEAIKPLRLLAGTWSPAPNCVRASLLPVLRSRIARLGAATCFCEKKAAVRRDLPTIISLLSALADLGGKQAAESLRHSTRATFNCDGC